MEKTDYLAVIDHALDSIFIVTKKIFEDDNETNEFFSGIEIGTILTVEAVICTDFGLEARVSYGADHHYEMIEIDIEYLATHCDLYGSKRELFAKMNPQPKFP